MAGTSPAMTIAGSTQRVRLPAWRRIYLMT